MCVTRSLYENLPASHISCFVSLELDTLDKWIEAKTLFRLDTKIRQIIYISIVAVYKLERCRVRLVCTLRRYRDVNNLSCLWITCRPITQTRIFSMWVQKTHVYRCWLSGFTSFWSTRITGFIKQAHSTFSFSPVVVNALSGVSAITWPQVTSV